MGRSKKFFNHPNKKPPEYHNWKEQWESLGFQGPVDRSNYIKSISVTETFPIPPQVGDVGQIADTETRRNQETITEPIVMNYALKPTVSQTPPQDQRKSLGFQGPDDRSNCIKSIPVIERYPIPLQKDNVGHIADTETRRNQETITEPIVMNYVLKPTNSKKTPQVTLSSTPETAEKGTDTNTKVQKSNTNIEPKVDKEKLGNTLEQTEHPQTPQVAEGASSNHTSRPTTAKPSSVSNNFATPPPLFTSPLNSPNPQNQSLEAIERSPIPLQKENVGQIAGTETRRNQETITEPIVLNHVLKPTNTKKTPQVTLSSTPETAEKGTDTNTKVQTLNTNIEPKVDKEKLGNTLGQTEHPQTPQVAEGASSNHTSSPTTAKPSLVPNNFATPPPLFTSPLNSPNPQNQSLEAIERSPIPLQKENVGQIADIETRRNQETITEPIVLNHVLKPTNTKKTPQVTLSSTPETAEKGTDTNTKVQKPNTNIEPKVDKEKLGNTLGQTEHPQTPQVAEGASSNHTSCPTTAKLSSVPNNFATPPPWFTSPLNSPNPQNQSLEAIAQISHVPFGPHFSQHYHYYNYSHPSIPPPSHFNPSHPPPLFHPSPPPPLFHPSHPPPHNLQNTNIYVQKFKLSKPSAVLESPIPQSSINGRTHTQATGEETGIFVDSEKNKSTHRPSSVVSDIHSVLTEPLDKVKWWLNHNRRKSPQSIILISDDEEEYGSGPDNSKNKKWKQRTSISQERDCTSASSYLDSNDRKQRPQEQRKEEMRDRSPLSPNRSDSQQGMSRRRDRSRFDHSPPLSPPLRSSSWKRSLSPKFSRGMSRRRDRSRFDHSPPLSPPLQSSSWKRSLSPKFSRGMSRRRGRSRFDHSPPLSPPLRSSSRKRSLSPKFSREQPETAHQGISTNKTSVSGRRDRSRFDHSPPLSPPLRSSSRKRSLSPTFSKEKTIVAANPVEFLFKYSKKHHITPPRFVEGEPLGTQNCQIFICYCLFLEHKTEGKGQSKILAKHEAGTAMFKFLTDNKFIKNPPLFRTSSKGMPRDGNLRKNAIAVLNELCPKRRLPLPSYSADYPTWGGVYVSECKLQGKRTIGKGMTKKAAKHDSAVKMLQELNYDIANLINAVELPCDEGLDADVSAVNEPCTKNQQPASWKPP